MNVIYGLKKRKAEYIFKLKELQKKHLDDWTFSDRVQARRIENHLKALSKKINAGR